MEWNEFLDKIRHAKKNKIPLGFTAGAIVKLIYVGAFNSFVRGIPEYVALPGYKRCQRMAEEALNAMRSKSKLPKATKTETVGIADINSDAALCLWRHFANPLFSWNLSSLYPKKLEENYGFRPTQDPQLAKKIPMSIEMPSDGLKKSCDLWGEWGGVFSMENTLKCYMQDQRLASIVGIITKKNSRYYGQGKRCLDVSFFDGYKEYDIVLWPSGGSMEYNKAISAEIEPCSFGLLVIKPSIWKGKQGGTLKKFYKMML